MCKPRKELEEKESSRNGTNRIKGRGEKQKKGDKEKVFKQIWGEAVSFDGVIGTGEP